jgi:ribosomal protection tetracycline resistance protein
MQLPIRNIAIMAHADAGKTTITEQFLFLGGQIRKPGNVDQGTAQTDFLPVEKDRGISVRSANTSFVWKEIRINLIDTPGHVDFSADVERVMRVPDGVILVLSAVEGVQAHTETLWAALRGRQIPVIFFINKLDRVGADSELVIRSIVKELKITPLCLQKTTGEGASEVCITSLLSPDNMQDQLVEHIVATDETLLNRYLDDQEPSFTDISRQLTRLIRSNDIFPLFFGSAKMGLGTRELLDAVVDYFPSPGGDAGSPLSALV